MIGQAIVLVPFCASGPERPDGRHGGALRDRGIDDACIVAAMRYRYVATREREWDAGVRLNCRTNRRNTKTKDEQSPAGRQNGSYLALAMKLPDLSDAFENDGSEIGFPLGSNTP